MPGKSPNSLEVSLGKSSTNGKDIFHPKTLSILVPYGGFLKWWIPKPWVSILSWSKFGWFVATPISGNLHIHQPFSFPRRHVLAASCTRSLGGELWIDFRCKQIFKRFWWEWNPHLWNLWPKRNGVFLKFQLVSTGFSRKPERYQWSTGIGRTTPWILVHFLVRTMANDFLVLRFWPEKYTQAFFCLWAMCFFSGGTLAAPLSVGQFDHLRTVMAVAMTESIALLSIGCWLKKKNFNTLNS